MSGPRPLAMFDGSAGAWHNALLQIVILAVFALPFVGYLLAVVGRKVRRAA